MISDQYQEKRIFLFAGHYGSGKTEIAVNFALDLAKQNHKTAIVDLDIVNPYFRTNDARDILNKNGVRVVASQYANTNVDIPALPAEINGLFEDKTLKVVFDVGGDDLGAKAVSRYRDDFVCNQTYMFFVVNIRRPMTTSLSLIEQAFYEIQDSARLSFNAIINNTNLLQKTTEKDLSEGLDIITRLSDKLKLPIAFNAVMDTVPEKVTTAFVQQSARIDIPTFFIRKHIKMDYI